MGKIIIMVTSQARSIPTRWSLSSYDYDEAVLLASNIIMDYGDGLTVSKATGAWRDDDGSIDSETSMVIDLAGFDLDSVHKICDKLKKELEQKSIMIVTFEETVDFY